MHDVLKLGADHVAVTAAKHCCSQTQDLECGKLDAVCVVNLFNEDTNGLGRSATGGKHGTVTL